jgi:methyl-accepting chemotaxis protein
VIIALLLSISLYITLWAPWGGDEASRGLCRVSAGDLAARTRVRYGDGAGELFGALDHMAKQPVHDRVRCTGAADQITHASKQIRAANQAVAAHREAGLPGGNRASVELTGTETNNTPDTPTSSRSAPPVAIRGGVMVGPRVNTMSEIDLPSRKIADIITVIDSIAFQTSILALNAAVRPHTR